LDYSIFIFSDQEIYAIILSIKVAFISSFFCLPIALFFAYLLARKQFVFKSVLESLVSLPLVLPPVAVGYLLLLVFGIKGLIGGPLFEILGIRISFSFVAALIASLVVSLPLAIRSIRSALEMVDPRYEKAAQSLGASPVQAFFKITIPIAYPGFISAFVLAFARSLGEFGATMVFAGSIQSETQTIPLALYDFIQTPGSNMASLRLLVVSLLLSFIALWLSQYLSKKTNLFN